MLHSWQDQLKEHAPSLRVHVYHGPGRDLGKKAILVRARTLVTLYGPHRAR